MKLVPNARMRSSARCSSILPRTVSTSSSPSIPQIAAIAVRLNEHGRRAR